MPASTPMPTKNPGDVLTSALWNSYLRDNLDKLLTRGHRVLTVAQFAALTGLEGTKGVVAPDEVYLEVDATNGIQWHLAYESGEPTYKWRYIGGPALVAEVAAGEASASTVYAALATAGPSIPLPRAGDYDVELLHTASSSSASHAFMSFDIGGTGAVDADAVDMTIAASTTIPGVRVRRKTALTAVTLTAKYRTPSAVSTTWAARTMSVVPVRLI